MESSLFVELKRRRVFRALVGYGISAFAVLQIVEPVMHGFRWPDAVLSYVVLALAAGFPIVVALAWIFDVNEGRIEKTPGRPLRAPLALALVGIGLLAAAPGLVWYFRFRSAPAVVMTPSIAVLPFADMSPAKDQEYFSDGIAEEILNSLAQVDGLRVAGRTSSFSFKGKAEDLGAIAEKLHVAHVLEGSVRKDGSHIRITAQLIAAADGYHVWSKTFDRELTGVFAVQDEIAKAVVDALRIKLLPGQFVPTSKPTTPEAYALYLTGTQLWWSGADTRAIVAITEKTLLADPNYAPAWASLSMLLRAQQTRNETPEAAAKRKQRVLEAAEKAVALDPALAIAYAARGKMRADLLWDWTGAKADMERSLELAPNDARGNKFYGGLLLTLGRVDEGMRLVTRSTELDPLLWTNWDWLGGFQFGLGKYELARKSFQRIIDLAPDRSEEPSLSIALTYLVEGRPDAAAPWVSKLREEDNRLYAECLLGHATGHDAQSAAALERFIERYGTRDPIEVADLYAWRGDADSAFAWLDKAVVAHDENIVDVRYDPFWRPLRGDPRWAAFLKRLNLPAD